MANTSNVSLKQPECGVRERSGACVFEITESQLLLKLLIDKCPFQIIEYKSTDEEVLVGYKILKGQGHF